MTLRSRRRGVGLLLAIVIMLMTAPLAFGQAKNALDASDQPIKDQSLTVASVTAAAAGWIAAHQDEGGQPGKVIGFAPVKAGSNSNIVVKLDTAVPAGTKMWPMLHVDAGTIGTYEFPGADAPVLEDNKVVMKQITLTAAAAAPAAPAPTLPATGDSGSAASLGLLAAVLLMSGALVLVLRRRA